ncbi:hypothetical protein [Asticcacaulis benevestitus]|uniref:Uncharacterized protein n=1 Tax=Asticcacaulis benevestitus DSM 16100 = ATCC BAA-896 TaxID=1121022 RepID=V4Q5T9_9CAUL|nr:hypothetical protein [Asticcacaulis benevestitus]ESQ93190.1 hypothetical protein ABENE_06470 [Asticcacaulis benevestitus DSM 16100 = ATCC BAA-896]
MLPYSEQEVLAANVNPSTGLATDYLNLFNEAIMLFEMGLDMPDMAEELADWKKHSYVEHFEKSGFEMKDIVISAYHHAPAELRCDFDDVCERALSVFDSSIDILMSSNLEDEAARADLTERLRDMKALVIEMDSHIHGRADMTKSLQSEVDALF